jgi:hypothetical protein
MVSMKRIHVRKVSARSYKAWVDGGPVHKARNKTAAKRAARRDAQSNPSGTTWALLAVGAAAVGIGAYFLLKPSSPTSDTSKALPGPSSSKPFGDPNDQNSIAYACNTAWKLHKLGHDKEAMSWGGRCSQGGATVPQADSQMYT